jgi:hypothetical protein
MDKPTLVHLMFRYLHTLDYTEGTRRANIQSCANQTTDTADTSLTSIPPTDIITHAQMCAIAECYGISSLHTLGKEKFKQAVEENWDCPEFARVIELVCIRRFKEIEHFKILLKRQL